MVRQAHHERLQTVRSRATPSVVPAFSPKFLHSPLRTPSRDYTPFAVRNSRLDCRQSKASRLQMSCSTAYHSTPALISGLNNAVPVQISLTHRAHDRSFVGVYFLILGMDHRHPAGRLPQAAERGWLRRARPNRRQTPAQSPGPPSSRKMSIRVFGPGAMRSNSWEWLW